ncbi:hypothetical protein B296_00052208, partial [Ensete ventricosum]
LVISWGGHLSGHVPISGSKNSALAVLAGALCCSGRPMVVRGVPDIFDARAMAAILRSLGAKVQERGGGRGQEDPGGVLCAGPPGRAARGGGSRSAGGCSVGAPPVDDLYLRGLSALGAVVELTQFTVIPNRIETGTFMVAAAITRSCVSLSPVIPCHLTSIIDKLSAVGCRISQKGDGILEVGEIWACCCSYLSMLMLDVLRNNLQVSAATATAGGDLRGFLNGLLLPTNLVVLFFRSHFAVEELQKLGARKEVNRRSAVVKGRTTQRKYV